MSVLTIEQARTFLRIEGVAHDDAIQDTIDAAEAVLTRLVGPLEVTATTAMVAPCDRSLLLPVVPVDDLTTVTDVDGNTISTADLDFDAATGIVTRADGEAFTARRYTVVYDAGRASLPADLLQAVKELTRHLWQAQRGPTRPGAQAEPNPGAAYLLPYRVQSLIEPHQLLGMG